jgi:indolepyruvate ferredoxin oxidoreductase, beta subunit
MDGSLAATEKPIGVAILAMGGQGGGVLADWIVALAEAQGFCAQSTSVPGVAQRTGATIYYVELIRPAAGRQPVLSMMPVPGDVDVVIAAEMMEAGRAIQRGLVSPDRTTLIASTHRALAVLEKSKPGDGRADPEKVQSAAETLARRFHSADMQALAERSGSVISASLFGALAGSGSLPFDRAAFEDTIRAAGVGVDGSLRAFAAGFDAVRTPSNRPPAAAVLPIEPQSAAIGGSGGERAELERAVRRVVEEFPALAHEMLRHGVRRLIDFQDVAYAHEYLDRMAILRALDSDAQNFALTVEGAKQVAVAMAYDDVIRVADLKTRASRFARVRAEVQAKPDQLVGMTEFFHPRLEEICATLPARLGLAAENSALLQGLVRPFCKRGRRIRTDRLSGFLPLYCIAGLRRWRRSLLRHQREQAHLDAWLTLVAAHASGDYQLAVELTKCRRLVKGYSDTHSRGLSKYDRIVGALWRLEGRADAADWIRRLRDAAFADEDGKMLDGALATVATLEHDGGTGR